MEPLVYSVDEVAKLLRMSRGAAYQAVRAGEIPAIRVGRLWLIERESFHAWLKGRPATTGTDVDTAAGTQKSDCATARPEDSTTVVGALSGRSRSHRQAAA